MNVHLFCRVILEITHNVASALSTPIKNVRFLHGGFDVLGTSFVAGDYQGNIYLFDINQNRYRLAIIIPAQ